MIFANFAGFYMFLVCSVAHSAAQRISVEDWSISRVLTDALQHHMDGSPQVAFGHVMSRQGGFSHWSVGVSNDRCWECCASVWAVSRSCRTTTSRNGQFY